MPSIHDKSYALLKLYNRLPPDAKGHSVRVAIYMQIVMVQILQSNSRLYPEAAGASEEEVLLLTREIGLYHDIGKAKIPASLLQKKGKLTEKERSEIKLHTLYIDDMLAPMLETVSSTDRPFLSAVIKTGRSHHENWDGTGYPAGLKGEEIPFLARLCAICDAYDAMTSSRMYSPAIKANTAEQEIVRCAGTQFDPDLTQAFSQCFHQFVEISRVGKL